MANGNFIVSWHLNLNLGQGGPQQVVRARILAPDGSLVGNEITVRTSAEDMVSSHVAPLDDGGFMVVWTEEEGFRMQPYIQRFDSAGEPVGAMSWVGSTVTSLEALRIYERDNYLFVSFSNGIIGVFTPDIGYVGAYLYFRSSQQMALAPAEYGWAAVWTFGSSIYRGPIRLDPPAVDDEILIDVLGNDSDPEGDPLSIIQVNGEAISAASRRFEPLLSSTLSGPVTLASGAIVSLSGRQLSYDPTEAEFAIALPQDATGEDVFSYTISDGELTDSANATIRLRGVNDAPVAVTDTFNLGQNDSLENITTVLLANDFDPDTGETAQISFSRVLDSAATGRVYFSGPGPEFLSYDTNNAFDSLSAGQTGTDRFSYEISDPRQAYATGQIEITVTGVNDAPLAVNDNVAIAEESSDQDVTSTLLANDSDPDAGETAQLAVTAIDTSSTTGLVTLENGVVTYSPNGAFNSLAAGQTATDSFGYTIIDTHGETANATAEITINGFDGYPLTVTTSGLGSGSVTSLPLGVNCGGGGSCTALFTQSTEVALTANVDAGVVFEGWSGDCLDNSAALCAVRMGGERNVSARFSLQDPPAGRIVAATLPGARSGYVGGPPISVFMSVLSRATTPAQACRIAAPGTPPFLLSYQQVDAGGNPIGDVNPLFDLGEGGAMNFVIALQPNATTTNDGYTFLPQIECENASLTPIEGVNSVLVSIGATPVPDILSIGTTPSADGVVRIPESGNRISFLSAAALNIGAGDGSAAAGQATVTASVDTGGVSLPLTLEVCETLSTGGCITPRGETSTSTIYDPNVVKFYAVFVRANEGEYVPFDPASSRVFLRFTDATGAMRSVTSAAVSAPAPAEMEMSASLSGRWSVLVRQDQGIWPPLERGSLIVGENGDALLAIGDTVRQVILSPGSQPGAEVVPFTIRNMSGQVQAGGRIGAGDALADDTGAFWGIRDARGEPDVLIGQMQGVYGQSVILGTEGSVSGQIGGCAVSGTLTGRGVSSLLLSGCAYSGRYAAAMDAPVNDNAIPAILIGNDRRGWRLEAAR